MRSFTSKLSIFQPSRGIRCPEECCGAESGSDLLNPEGLLTLFGNLDRANFVDSTAREIDQTLGSRRQVMNRASGEGNLST